jgi:hypothetical protein
VPEHDEQLDAIDHQHDRRDTWVAIVISAVALGVMLVASLLLVVSAARA